MKLFVTVTYIKWLIVHRLPSQLTHSHWPKALRPTWLMVNSWPRPKKRTASFIGDAQSSGQIGKRPFLCDTSGRLTSELSYPLPHSCEIIFVHHFDQILHIIITILFYFQKILLGLLKKQYFKTANLPCDTLCRNKSSIFKTFVPLL